MKYRLLFVVTGLSTGGAEMMLYKCISAMDRDLFEPSVISLTDLSDLEPMFKKIDVPVDFLGMQRGHFSFKAMYRLITKMKEAAPDLVQTWMYHADLLGGVGSLFAGKPPVLWNVRNSTLEPGGSKGSTILTARICGKLSRFIPAKIVCCAESARQVHVGWGYDADRMVVIPNGFDLSSFRPDHEARNEVCRELDIPRESFLVGLVGRFDDQKDHKTFIEAASLLKESVPEAHFVMCGNGVDPENEVLSGWIETFDLKASFSLLGRRSDISRITAALDVASSSSAYGEAFSNTLGEAMACGVPCVTTDVGDSAYIVGDTGRVVATRDPEAFAAALKELADLGPEGRAELGQRARVRVQETFSLDTIVQKYETLYMSLLQGRCNPVPGDTESSARQKSMTL